MDNRICLKHTKKIAKSTLFAKTVVNKKIIYFIILYKISSEFLQTLIFSCEPLRTDHFLQKVYFLKRRKGRERADAGR